MKYLFSDIDNIKSLFKNAQEVLLALDYDGTIVPICSKPEEATLNPKTREVLRNISEISNICLCVVTGRALEDIKKLVDIEKLHYIANHGFEILHNGRLWIHPEAKRIQPLLKNIAAELGKRFASPPGLNIEDKDYTLTIHYRGVKDLSPETIKKGILQAINGFKDRLTITHGKKVFEIRPKIDWNKGKALLKFKEKVYGPYEPLTVYIGDDRTDEDAFRILKNSISILVGKRDNFSARYFVNDVNEVILFLEGLSNKLTSPCL